MPGLQGGTMKKLMVFVIICATLPAISSNFNLNLKKGDHFITTMSSTQAVIRDVGGQQTQVDTSIEMTLSFDVTGSDETSYMVTMRYTHIIISSRGAGWEYSYDSDPAADTGNSISKEMSVFYRNLVGQPIFLILDRKTGTIRTMSGWDTLNTLIVDKLTQGTKENRKKLADMLVSSIKNGMVSGGPNSLFPPLTGKEIRKGNHWVIQSNLPILSGLTLRTTYSVRDILSDSVKLSISSFLSTASTTTPIQTGATKVQYKLNGTQTGMLTIDEETGWITEAHLDQELQGTLTLIDMGIIIPIKLSGQTNVRSSLESEAAGK